jgi:hypothetical protein
VRHEDHRGPLLLRRGDQELHHLLAGEGVERTRGLVREHDARLVDQRTRDRRTLRLTRGHLTRAMIGHLLHAEAFEPPRRPVERLLPRTTRQQQRERDVLEQIELGHELAQLENEAEGRSAKLGPRALTQRVDPFSVEPDLPFIGAKDPGQAVEER